MKNVLITIALAALIGCAPAQKIVRHNGANFLDETPSLVVKLLTEEPKDIKNYTFLGYKVIWADGINTPLPALMGLAVQAGLEYGADIGLITYASESFDMVSQAGGYGATTTVGISPGSGGQVGASPTPGASRAWSTSGYRGLPSLHIFYFKRIL
jgi:hypothetical protein